MYVIVCVPGPALTEQNWLPTTPGPLNWPPAGFAVKLTQGVPSQNGPIVVIVGITW